MYILATHIFHEKKTKIKILIHKFKNPIQRDLIL